MEYNSILDRIEEQKKDLLSAKLFRYAGLIQAIEFFSQKLNFDQILDAGFDFVNELLTVEHSAVFVLQGNSYILRKLKGYENGAAIVKNNEKLENFAVLHGGILHDREHLERFFEGDILSKYNVSVVIPLIMDNVLFGFIFIDNKMVGQLNEEDYIISEALMKLLNNALENYKRYEELQKANKELDEKIFNLFAINQSSKALLSELSLDVLYNLSVDVFSELTQNSITGFVLFDEKSEKFILKAFKDIYYNDIDSNTGLTLNKKARVDTNRVIINTSEKRDVLYFNSLFTEGIDGLKALKVHYIILLIKNGKILGFVTLGQSVTGVEYKTGMFELIESLASATYIALSNAQLFKQVNEQKKIIQSKLEKLTSLNDLMKNINSSSSVQTLIELTLRTFEISFLVDKALIALFDKEKGSFHVEKTLNISTKKREIKLTDSWKRVMEGDTVYEAREDGVLKYIDKALIEDIGDSSGILIIPIYLDRLEIELLGVLIFFKYKKTAINDEENILTMETVAGHIAPVLSNLFTIEEQKRFLLPNYIEMFKKDLKESISEALEFSLDLEVLQVVDTRKFVFKGNTIVGKLETAFKKVYPFSNNDIFIICSDDKDIGKKLKKIASSNDINVKRLKLGKDFRSFQEFFKLF
ncbi:MAG: GAF domain-containing protein [Clostridia bacterium]|nr:GAF domain-containing protein [Clostridia bacterium]